MKGFGQGFPRLKVVVIDTHKLDMKLRTTNDILSVLGSCKIFLTSNLHLSHRLVCKSWLLVSIKPSSCVDYVLATPAETRSIEAALLNPLSNELPLYRLVMVGHADYMATTSN